MYSEKGLSRNNHYGFLMLWVTFLSDIVESIFQEICSRAENFLDLSFSSPGRGVPFTIQDRTNDLPSISDADLPVAHEVKHLYEQTYNGQLTDKP